MDSTLVKQASEGQKVLIVLDQTTFYGESGGQVGDIGTIFSKDVEVLVDNVIRKKNVFLHYGTIKKGILTIGQKVKTNVNPLIELRLLQIIQLLIYYNLH